MVSCIEYVLNKTQIRDSWPLGALVVKKIILKNKIVKVCRFSTECTSVFIANVYITSKNIIISYLMSARPLIFFI